MTVGVKMRVIEIQGLGGFFSPFYRDIEIPAQKQDWCSEHWFVR